MMAAVVWCFGLYVTILIPWKRLNQILCNTKGKWTKQCMWASAWRTMNAWHGSYMRSAGAEHDSGRWYRVCAGAAAAAVVGCRARAAACSSACSGANARAQSASGCTARRVCGAAAACARRAARFLRARWCVIALCTSKSATCSASSSAKTSPRADALVRTILHPDQIYLNASILLSYIAF